MKKYLVFLITLLTSLFIFGINVEAKTEESSTYNYNLKFINYNDLSDSEKNNLVYTYNSGTATINLKNYFELYIDYFNNQTKYDSYFIYSGDLAQYGGIMYLFNKEETINSAFLTYVDSNPKNMRLSLLSNNFANYFYYMSYKGYVIYDSISSSWKYTSEIYNNKSYTNMFRDLIFSNSTGFRPTEVYYASNYIEDIIYTTDLKFDSSDSSIKYNNVYYNNELLFSNGNSVLNKFYNYEGLIETNDKSKIEINFKIPDEETFSFDLDFLMDYSYGLLSKPYLEYKVNDSSFIIDFIESNEKTDSIDINGNEVYRYLGTYGKEIEFNQNLKELKIIIDISSTIDDIYLKFSSKLDYTINFEYTIDTIDYFKTIIMNDVYGLYLIPKTLNSDNISTIYLCGLYNIGIKLIDDEDYNEVIKNYNNSNFIYHFKNNSNGYLVYFENVDYSTDSDDSYYITFDTRYFNYSIKELEFDSPIINNPNNGEDLILPPSDNINKNQDISSFINYLEKAFNQSKIGEYFNIVYYGFMKSKIGNYIFILIIFSIILLLLSSMKK